MTLQMKALQHCFWNERAHSCVITRVVSAKCEQWSREGNGEKRFLAAYAAHGGSAAKTSPSQTVPPATQAIDIFICLQVCHIRRA